MGDSTSPALRHLPRVFIFGIPDPAPRRIQLDQKDADRLRRSLHLSTGDEAAILPGDGRLLHCRMDGKSADLVEVLYPETDSVRRLTLSIGMPRADALEDTVRIGTELGVEEILLFQCERSTVKWDASKLDKKLARLSLIAQSAAESSFRAHVPSISHVGSLADLLKNRPNAIVLSESEDVMSRFEAADNMTIVIGPEGGWTGREIDLIGDRARTLGPRVFTVPTAAAAACTMALL